MGSPRAALCHTVISPVSSSISSGGLAPLQSSCQVVPGEAPALSSLLASEGSCLQLCLVRGRESDSPGAAQGRQGASGDSALLCPSPGKLSISQKFRACCRVPCVLELWARAAFPCFQFMVLGQGRHWQIALGKLGAVNLKETEYWANFFPPTPQDSQVKKARLHLVLCMKIKRLKRAVLNHSL